MWCSLLLAILFTLVNCNQNVFAVNPCCSFPCENGGVCVDDGDKYTCDCTRTSHYGVNCQKPSWWTWFTSLIAPSEETKHFLLTHFNWFWWIINNVPFIRNRVMRAAYFSRTDFIPVPHAYTSYHEYPTMEAHYNRSYFARTLPPVPKNCPTPFGIAGKKELPSAEELANKFLKRGKFKTDHTNTSWLFMFFAQHFTHEFFKTVYHRPAFSWGNHGVDVSHIYGQDVERQNKLRSFEDGKLKSQIINGEEWPPYLKDVDNVTMQYPPNTPEDQKFAIGHPFYGMLPGLFMYATIWLREHNRVCTILRKEHPHWDDERLYQTGKLVITGEVIKIVIEDYVNHLANYNLKLKYNPELVFDHGYDYDNRIHLEFNHMYHWHPFSPDEFDISGTKYSISEFMYHPEIVIKHGMSSFVDSMSKGLCGKNGATKRCFNCHDEHNSGAKKCRTCLVQRKTDKIDIEDERIRDMKTPNASKQFDKLKYRAKVLNFHCGWDIVVMASHRHSRGTSFVRFGTSGLGEEFIGANEHLSSSPTGKAVFNVFSSYIRENKKSDPKRPTLGKEEPPSQSMSPVVSIPSPVTPIPFATSLFPVTSISSSMSTSGPSSLSSSINSGPLSLSSSVTSQPLSLSSSVTSRPSSLSSSVTSRPSSLSSSVTSQPSPLSSSITSRPSSLSSSVTSQPSSLSSSSRPSSLSSSVTSKPSSLSSSIISRPSSVSSSVNSRPSLLSSSVTSRPSSLSCSMTSQPSSISSSVTSRPSSFSHPPFIDPPFSTSLSSSPTTGPTTTDSASLNTTIKLPSDALVVVDNGKCVAVGKSVPLTSVHGQIVPDTHKCILLTWAQDNYLAPFPCGNRDLKENLYFSKDSFYAVPRTMLRQLIRKNNQYSLSPIS